MRILTRLWARDVFIPSLTEVDLLLVPSEGSTAAPAAMGTAAWTCSLVVRYQLCPLVWLHLNLFLQGQLLLLAFL